jgi:uncharacterized protein YdeI (YjbR/CyaY-like superfamily)
MTNPLIDEFIDKAKHWKEELKALRAIMLSIPELTEERKWYQPCYTAANGANVLILGCFKEFITIGFFKGVLLSDPNKLLEMQGQNQQSSLSMKFSSLDQINQQQAIIISYVKEAIEIERKGLKVQYKKVEEYPVPDELNNAFKENTEFQHAFEKLTPGRQRGWLLHFNQPKQSATRISRIEKALPKILEGKGLNDRAD